MTEPVYDLIVIGGGPAGLMCALTGITGIPINPPRHFKGLILEQHSIGEFARYGKLRLTHRWSYNGAQLVKMLLNEVRSAPLTVHENERVVALDTTDAPVRIDTTAGSYKAHAVAICTGFFPHGPLARFRRSVRVVFSPPQLEAYHLPAGSGDTVAILGGGPGSFEYALALHKLRPELHFRVCIDDPDQPLPESPDPAITVRHQSFTVVHDHPGGVTVMADSLDGSNPSEEELRFLLVDYNSYTLKTRVTDFLAGSPVVRRAGYIVADSKGRTALPGILAAGNIVTPISGVLTALDTGFKAGLTIYDRLHMDRFGESPIVFPWLPLSGLESHPLYESVYGPDAEQE